MVHELYTYPFSLSVSKADPFMVRRAHHERNEDIRCRITYARLNKTAAHPTDAEFRRINSLQTRAGGRPRT